MPAHDMCPVSGPKASSSGPTPSSTARTSCSVSTHPPTCGCSAAVTPSVRIAAQQSAMPSTTTSSRSGSKPWPTAGCSRRGLPGGSIVEIMQNRWPNDACRAAKIRAASACAACVARLANAPLYRLSAGSSPNDASHGR